MRTLIIGDAHFRSELPYAASFKDGRRSEWEEVKTEIHKAGEDCDSVVMMGDNLNSRNNSSTVLREFVEFLQGFGKKEIHILCGNHERAGGVTALDFLDRVNHPNWHVYTEIEQVTIGGHTAMMIPYVTPGSLKVKDIPEANKKILELLKSSDYAFAHLTIEGTQWGGGSWKDLEQFEATLPIDTMKKLFGLSFAGHIHEKQKLDERVYVVGSMFTSEVGEEEKSVWVVEGSKVTEYHLPVRAIRKITVPFMSSPTKLAVDLPKTPANSIVKLVVSDPFYRDHRDAFEYLKGHLKQVDALIVVESYPKSRQKLHFDENSLDLSVDNMLKVYAEARDINYEELKDGFDILRN